MEEEKWLIVDIPYNYVNIISFILNRITNRKIYEELIQKEISNENGVFSARNTTNGNDEEYLETLRKVSEEFGKLKGNDESIKLIKNELWFCGNKYLFTESSLFVLTILFDYLSIKDHNINPGGDFIMKIFEVFKVLFFSFFIFLFSISFIIHILVN